MFKIQISNPAILAFNSEMNINLEDAIEAIFPPETEHAFLIWNHKFIPLNYKYDVSLMILDLIKIIGFLKDPKTETIEIHWPSNTFACIWNLKKENQGLIKIHSSWQSVIGGMEDLLNKFGVINIDSKKMEEEIIKLLSFVKTALDKSNINREKIIDFDVLENVLVSDKTSSN